MNLQEMSVAELTKVYNSKVAADKQIKKFSTKDEGIRRVGKLLEQEKPAKVAKADKGPRRIDRIVEALRQEARSIDWMAESFNTTRRVIFNDLCDIRKMHKLVSDRKSGNYKIEA